MNHNNNDISITCKTVHRTFLADQITPVILFQRLRRHYAEVLLLESSDYSSQQNSVSIIAFDPLLRLSVKPSQSVLQDLCNHRSQVLAEDDPIHSHVQHLIDAIKTDNADYQQQYVGVFGYCGYDTVQKVEKITFDTKKEALDIPLMQYAFYRFTIVIDHYTEQLTILEQVPLGQESTIDEKTSMLFKSEYIQTPFVAEGLEKANMTDEDFIQIVNKCKAHCQRGDIFQVVPSRRFSRPFSGDEFNVYRALRSINPSPYLFYFDYVDFKIFGSSPEVQIKIQNNVAEVHPIAGTFRRSGDIAGDMAMAEQLKNDAKETAEHIMLVDLARNDLSKNCTEVTVDQFKEVQFFSHVIHMTSVVKGILKQKSHPIKAMLESFPAGTLSGAPKHRAMQIIDDVEPDARRFYGGMIGMIGLYGDINHAIIIRSFLSKDRTLHYQSGAGIVIDSDPQKELQEVNHKIQALRKAIRLAEQPIYTLASLHA